MTKALKLLLLLLLSLSASAQVHDAGGWIALNSRFRLNKRVDLVASHQVRTSSLSLRVDQVFIEPELRYSMKNGLKWAVAYRPSIAFHLEQGTHFRHRYHVQVQYSIDLGDWEIGTRLRFQQRFVPVRNSDRLPASDQPMALRNKWVVEYTDFKKTTPFVQFEYFIGLSGQVPAQITTLRYKGGVELDLKKRFDLAIFYMAEHEIADQQPSFYHVVGIALSREFRWKKQKKKKTDPSN